MGRSTTNTIMETQKAFKHVFQMYLSYKCYFETIKQKVIMTLMIKQREQEKQREGERREEIKEQKIIIRNSNDYNRERERE